MSNYVPRIILNLIKQQAYTSGQLRKLERQLEKEKANCAAMEAAYLEAKNDLAKIEEKIEATKAGLQDIATRIEETAPTLDINDIRSIEHRPKTSGLGFGELSKTLVDIFLEANGKPLTTGEIRDQMVERLKLPNATAKDRNDTYERISKRLRFYAGQGIIKRLHAPDYGVRMGTWVWVGLD